MSQPAPNNSRPPSTELAPPETASVITPPKTVRGPTPVLMKSGDDADANLRSFEQAQLRLFQENFNLVLQQVAQWIALQKQQANEVELTLGKVRAFAELAERIVNTSDAQLEKLVVVTTALIQLYERIQNPPQENQEG